jgi:peroxiredoxin Q/BCP
MIKIGDVCPEFRATNQNGEVFNILDLVGQKNAVIFFYPRDFTPGCTAEVCSFRDHYDEFSKLDCEVIGISGDTSKTHLAFHNRYQLNYHLLSDEKNSIRKQFKVPKNVFGLLPGRVTYVINKKGVIIGIHNALTKATGHISFAIDCLSKKQ